MYHISTSKNKYYLNFYMVYKADDTPSDVGLSKIEIATEETVNRENLCGIHRKTEYLSSGNKHKSDSGFV